MTESMARVAFGMGGTVVLDLDWVILIERALQVHCVRAVLRIPENHAARERIHVDAGIENLISQCAARRIDPTGFALFIHHERLSAPAEPEEKNTCWSRICYWASSECLYGGWEHKRDQ